MATTATSASPSTQDLDVSHLDLQDGGIPSSSSASSSRIQTYPIDIKRKKIRVAIVTENFLPKIDGVTRTLARLLEHLHSEGHEAMVLGPDTGLTQYAGHPVVGTFGVPLIIYPGLKLNFMRPRFIRRLQQFKPDVIHFVDPIWLGAQMLPVVQKWLPEVPCVSSYHTNLPTYATLFGMPWLEATMWRLTRNLHDRCEVVLCPSESTRRMLQGKGFTNVEIWSRGVDMDLFSPSARDENLRSSWGCTPKPASLTGPLATPSMRASELDEAALTNLLGNKLGLVSSTAGRRFSSRSSSSSSDDESFIRTPPTGPMLPSLAMTPELSPPPSYDSLSLPPLPSGGFSLPPPAMSMRKDDNTSSGSSSNSGESKTVILYVGRISWEKNLRLLIEAFRLLPSSVKAAAKLVFVGDGPARGELTRLCAKLGLDASFMGHQKGTRLAAMYASSSVFAFPSFTETFGQVVLEALASGLPVVGLHAEGTSDLVTHGRTGLLLDVVTATKNASLNARENAAAAKENGNSKPNSPALKATTISDFATAATSATKSHSSSSSIRSSPLAMRAVQNGKSTQFSAPTSGLSTPIPSVGAFASSMSPSSPAFAACSRRYSMLLERLIRDRTLRATMGQRALESARSKTWYEAMEKAVNGYEVAIKKRGAKNLTDDELEEIRGQMRGKEILTGPATKIAVFLYLALFLYFWHLLLH